MHTHTHKWKGQAGYSSLIMAITGRNVRYQTCTSGFDHAAYLTCHGSTSEPLSEHEEGGAKRKNKQERSTVVHVCRDWCRIIK